MPGEHPYYPRFSATRYADSVAPVSIPDHEPNALPEPPTTEPRPPAAAVPSPFERLGGEAALHTLVDRFYDVMEQDPEYAALRAMHAADLAPMREKLYDFLSGWLGGPPRYFARPDRACIVSAHGPFAIGPRERDEWLGCMHKALAALPLEAQFRRALEAALARTADALRNR